MTTNTDTGGRRGIIGNNITVHNPPTFYEGGGKMTKERLQMEAIRLAEKANRMVKSGELSKFQAGFYLREAVKDLIALAKKVEMKN